MNVLDFAASAVRSLAWPATVVIAMGLFRAPLATMIGRIRQITVSEGTTVIDFRAALAAVEGLLGSGGTRAVARARVAGLLAGNQPPVATIDAAWAGLQEALGRGTSPVTQALAEAVATLHALRNQVVAGGAGGVTVTIADALRFEDAAATAVAKIQAG